MKTFPTDPMRQNDRLIAAFCDDLFDLCVNGGTGTPRADRVVEIMHQLNTPREPGAGNSLRSDK
jgi:hypothetical protein